ncbi:MAG: cytochrome c biogenesis protein CcsA [Planctomycetes bacterium]|nr:cytochrome c biogenesis protein CcsA [Planctomycetota bacterium]
MRLSWIPFLLLLSTACSRPVPTVNADARQRPVAWSPAAIEAARSIPLQHEGRVKPFDTLAAFTLYLVHGRRDMQFTFGGPDANWDGKPKNVLTPTEWLLDVWCFPEQANQYPLFRIENAKALDFLFPDEAHAQQQDFVYVSYRKLVEPVAPDRPTPIARLMQQVRELRARQAVKDMEYDEQALVHLHDQFFTYNTLVRTVESLHMPYLLKGDRLQALFGGKGRATYAEVLGKARDVATLAGYLRSLPEAERGTGVMIADELKMLGEEEDSGPALFVPPPAAAPGDHTPDHEKWFQLGDLARLALAGQLQEKQQQQLAALEEVATAESMPARERAILAFRELAVAAAGQRGEFEKVDLEAKYYAWSLHYHALHWFLPGFLAVALSWVLMPFNRRLTSLAGWVAFAFTTIGLGYLTADLVLRCLITERPPIKNLYDTFLFICAIGVAAALVAELITRLRVALAVAPFLGAVLIMLARVFEVSDGSDTMRQLQAVLDSNYWLATHVTTINMGYAAGMLAMLIADVWLLLRAFRVAERNQAFLKTIVRMTYGVTCFGLLFTVVGTILGGVWANDSWGRFWGWDPKENGALLICLAQVALLHGRLCGWFRDFTFSLLAGVTGMLVAFSWFHVNLLNVGLHSYGFSTGLKSAVFTFYGIQTLLLVIGVLGHLARSLSIVRRVDNPAGTDAGGAWRPGAASADPR